MSNPQIEDQEVVDKFFDGYTHSQCAEFFGISKSEAVDMIDGWPGWKYMWAFIVENYSNVK